MYADSTPAPAALRGRTLRGRVEHVRGAGGAVRPALARRRKHREHVRKRSGDSVVPHSWRPENVVWDVTALVRRSKADAATPALRRGALVLHA
jgi:hypothetical protein